MVSRVYTGGAELEEGTTVHVSWEQGVGGLCERGRWPCELGEKILAQRLWEEQRMACLIEHRRWMCLPAAEALETLLHISECACVCGRERRVTCTATPFM